MTLSTFDLANHWPFLRSRLLFRDSPSKPNAQLRALDVLCRQLVSSGGDPVPMSRKRLRMFGMTPGQAGRTWAALQELEERKIVTKWGAPLGPRADHWVLLAEDFGRRWRRMPWESSGREVQMVVEHCSCVAKDPLAARFPGQRLRDPRGNGRFDLPRSAHLVFRGRFRDTDAHERAGDDGVSRENVNFPRGFSASLHLSSVGRRTTSSSLGTETDDEALRTLKEAVEAATGERLWGAPLEELRELAARCNGELDQLADELRNTRGIKAPPRLVAQAPAMLAQLQKDAYDRRQAQRAGLERQLANLRAFATEDDYDTLEQIREIEQALTTLGVDA